MPKDPTPYVYKPLDGPKSIRIIALEPSLKLDAPLICSIVHDDRDDILHGFPGSMHYETVSYTWGESPRFTSCLFCESGATIVRITPNVEDILRYLRKAARIRYLWIDAICLNQNDHAEKSIQVPLMAEIYSQCRKTHLYLGGVTGSSTLFSFFRRLVIDRHIRIPDSGIVASHNMESFLHHPFWSRRWILQEVVLGRDATIRSGRDSIPWATLRAALQLVDTCHRTKIKPPALTLANHSLDFITRYEPLIFLCLLDEFAHAACADPRDRLFALYGLCPSGTSVLNSNVDYTIPWTKVYERVAVDAHQRSSVLGRRESKIRTPVLGHLIQYGSLYHHSPVLPSWVPNWSSTPFSTLHQLPPRHSASPENIPDFNKKAGLNIGCYGYAMIETVYCTDRSTPFTARFLALVEDPRGDGEGDFTTGNRTELVGDDTQRHNFTPEVGQAISRCFATLDTRVWPRAERDWEHFICTAFNPLEKYGFDKVFSDPRFRFLWEEPLLEREGLDEMLQNSSMCFLRTCEDDSDTDYVICPSNVRVGDIIVPITIENAKGIETRMCLVLTPCSIPVANIDPKHDAHKYDVYGRGEHRVDPTEFSPSEVLAYRSLVTPGKFDVPLSSQLERYCGVLGPTDVPFAYRLLGAAYLPWRAHRRDYTKWPVHAKPIILV